MTITYRGYSYTGFQAFIDKQARTLPQVNFTASYAHPIDGHIMEALNATPIKALMAKIIDFIVSYQSGQQLIEGVPIDHYSFPEIFDVLKHCAKKLNISLPYAVAHHFEDSLFNAYTSGTDEYSFIVISPSLCQAYTIPEARFVLGHECGHIAARHVTYQTAVQIITQAVAGIEAFTLLSNPLTQTMLRSVLLAWSRYAEITSDRAGLLCCGSIEAAEQALLKLVIGLARSDRVNIDDYLRKARTMEEFHNVSKVRSLLSHTHPHIPQRIMALRLFASSEIYYELSGQPRPVGQVLLSRAQLNQRVNQLLRG